MADGNNGLVMLAKSIYYLWQYF